MTSTSVYAPTAMVASADHLATRAGLGVLANGGNAVDAALAANAVIAITSPHLCGMGGDLFALVHHKPGPPDVLNASGRAGSGADPDRLRSQGWTHMPLHGDIRTVTTPGCVDGWVALHTKFGTIPLADLWKPAIDYADRGFPASPLLCAAVKVLPTTDRWAQELLEQARQPGDLVRRPGLARALEAIIEHGRQGFYQGEFGVGLVAMSDGYFTDLDLTISNADWVRPLGVEVWDRFIWTVPPNSQGYLTLSGSWIAERLALPDPSDGQWAHLTIEAAKVAGHDRPDVLNEHASGSFLLDPTELAARANRVDPYFAAALPSNSADGDTTYLCVVDGAGMGVSLIQSNAAGFGSHLFEPATGINLHNRGLGFSLTKNHPSEYRPGRRPPHTLAPALATHLNGDLSAVFGTMGGDAQPQILLQLAARLFRHGQHPAQAIGAPRWTLRGPSTGFDTWTSGQPAIVELEVSAPASWREALVAAGHRVVENPHGSAFGHAHAIVVDPRGVLVGAADPRCRTGAAHGF